MAETVIQFRPKRRKAADPVLVDIKDVAHRLGVSERTVARWVAANSIPHVYLGAEGGPPLRFPVELVTEWWSKRLRGDR